MKILLVDDDKGLLELLSYLVQRAGFRPIVAYNGSTALQLFTEHRPNLVVLDIRLGDDDGLEVLQALRRASDVPVIMLSSLDSEEDIERALELGADDYVTKPFLFREIVARIQAVIRRTCDARSVATIDHSVRVGSLALNPREYRATLDGLPLALTRTEFRLLQLLMENADKVVPHGVLLKQVWGYEDPTANDVVRAAIYRLRRKLDQTNTDQALLIRTFPGVGVMLQYRGEQSEVARHAEFTRQVAPSGEPWPKLVAA